MDEDRLLIEIKDITKIVKLKSQLEHCAAEDGYFEIDGKSSKLLWEYISALETAILL